MPENRGEKIKGIPMSILKDDEGKVKSIEKVEMPGEGGMLTFFEGVSLPFPGFPQYKIVQQVDLIKRFLVAQANFAIGMIKASWVGAIGWLMNVRKVVNTFWKALRQLYPLIVRHKPDPKKFSHPVREIYRAFDVLIEREVRKDGSRSEKMLEKWEMIRDVVCMILEYDNAYRWRFQDVMMEIDMDKIKFDRIDEYWIAPREDYKFLGLTKEERLQRLKNKGYVNK